MDLKVKRLSEAGLVSTGEKAAHSMLPAMLHPHAEGHHGFLEVCGLPGAQVFGLCMTPKPDGSVQSGACCSRIVRTRNQVVRTAQHVALGYVVELLGLRDFFHGNIRRECSWL